MVRDNSPLGGEGQSRCRHTGGCAAGAEALREGSRCSRLPSPLQALSSTQQTASATFALPRASPANPLKTPNLTPHLIPAVLAAELATRVQHCEHSLKRRLARHGMRVDGDAAAVVRDNHPPWRTEV